MTPANRPDQTYLTPSQAARRLGVSASTIRRWEREGVIAAAFRTPGGARRYSPQVIPQLRRHQQTVQRGGFPGFTTRTDRRPSSGPPGLKFTDSSDSIFTRLI